MEKTFARFVTLIYFFISFTPIAFGQGNPCLNADMSIVGNAIACENLPIRAAADTNLQAGVIAYIWHWNYLGTVPNFPQITDTFYSVFDTASFVYNFSNLDTCSQASYTFFVALEIIDSCNNNTHINISNVTIFLKPRADFQFVQNACVGQPVTFSDQTCPINSSFRMYQWDFGVAGTATDTSSLQNPTFTYSQAGTYTVSLAVFDTCGMDFISYQVVVHPTPIADAEMIIGSNPIAAEACLGDILVFTNQSIHADSADWTISPFPGTSNILVENNDSLVFLANQAGSYHITLGAVSDFCGIDIWDTIVAVYEPISLNLALGHSICDSSTVSLLDSLTVGGTIDSIVWSLNGNPIQPAGTLTLTNNSNLIVATAYGPCGIERDTGFVSVLSPGSAQILAPDTSVFCSTDLPLTLSGTNGSTWTSPVVSPNGVLSASMPLGVYHQIILEGICVIADTIDAIAYAPPLVNLTLDSAVCDSAVISPTNFLVSSGTIDSMSWSLNGLPTSVANPLTLTADTNELVVTVYSPACEEVRDTAFVYITPSGLSQILEPDTLVFCTTDPPYTLSAMPNAGIWVSNIVDANGVIVPDSIPVNVYHTIYYYKECQTWDSISMIVYEPPMVEWALSVEACSVAVISPMDSLILSGNIDSLSLMVNGIATSLAPPLSLTADTNELIVTAYGFAPCAQQSDTVYAFITQLGIAQILGQDTLYLCSTGAPIQLTTASQGGAWAGPIVDSVGMIDPAIVPTDTFYTVYYGGECMAADSVVIWVYPTEIQFQADTVYCSNMAVDTLTASPIGGIWSGAGIVNPSLGEFDPAVAGAGSHVLTYSYFQPNAQCPVMDSITVWVNELSVDFYVTNCIGLSLSFDTLNTSPTYTSIVYDFGGGNTLASVNPSFTFPSAGVFPVSVTIEDGMCSYTVSQNVTVEEPPVAVFSLSDSIGCSPLMPQIQDLSQGSNLLYVWQVNGAIVSQSATPPSLTLIAPIEDSVYHITLSLSNDCGTSTFTDSVRVVAAPNPVITPLVTTTCSGDSLSFSTAQSTGTPTYCMIDYGNGVIELGCNPSPQAYFTDTVPRIYTITYTMGNFCDTLQYTTTIEVIPTDVSAFFHVSNLTPCIGEPVTFSNGSTAGHNVSWDLGDGNTAGGDTIVHTFTSAGTQYVTLYLWGCGFDSLTVPIDVLEEPEASIDHLPSACVGEEVVFDIQTTAANTWLYFGDGDSTAINNLPSHVYTQPGTYTISLQITNTNLCEAEVSSSIVILPAPVALFEHPGIVCLNDTLAFENTSVGDIATYYWDFGDGHTSPLANPTHVFDTIGQFEVALTTVSGANACSDTYTLVVSVQEAPMALFVPSTHALCNSNDSIDLTNLSAGNLLHYAWDFGNGTTSTLQHPSIVYAQAGVYPITLSATNNYGCWDAFTDTVKVYAQPEAQIVMNADLICVPTAVTFSVEPTPYTGILWLLDRYTSSLEDSPTYYYTQADTTYKVRVILDYEGRCFDTATLEVHTYQAPIADFTYTQDPPSRIKLHNQSLYHDWQVWDFGYGATSTEPNPTHDYYPQDPDTFTITLRVMTDEGCWDIRDTTFIYDPNPTLFIPNAFSPNYDGNNDVFKIGVQNLTNLEFLIYNRWGKLIHTSSDPAYIWDGTYGRDCHAPEGVYSYRVKAMTHDGQQIERTGTITLIR